MRLAREHSQRRILDALRLAPMSRQQLSTCLMLDRSTVTTSINDLQVRQKVRPRRGTERASHFGPPTVVFELLRGDQLSADLGKIRWK